MKAKILLVEDDRNTAEITRDCLEDAGHCVICCKEAGRALEWLKTNAADLLISDINLPGISGIKFCEMVRQNESTATIPILMLTVLDDESHKVESFKTGADDYLVKPFSLKELAARVEAMLRRQRFQGRVDRALKAKDIEVNMDSLEVLVKGGKVKLLPKEFDLLVLFLSRQGRVLTHQFIADSIWGYDQIATRQTIKVWVHRLRKKLGSLGRRIQSSMGKGYKWE
ncbi:MAG: hypothetical protein A3J74_05085 [Elusimicrobia bacterium RIFCSPHIGHO2_02_FULL_57_9]|nr:MAG: hypothetical protein A3J74_05085 [Elusimicrobia bacterium RIFCSPHIGHO2_02_FULL_57_9]